MDKIKDITSHILDEVAHGLTCEDEKAGGRMFKVNHGASLKLYQRVAMPGCVILYVEHPSVNDPIVYVAISFNTRTWAAGVGRCDTSTAELPKDREYPIARFSHGVAATVKAVREQVKLVLGARLVDGIESAPPLDAEVPAPPDPWEDDPETGVAI